MVLMSRLSAALERLNAGRMGHHALPPEATSAAVDELTRDRSAVSVEAANREVCLLLKEGNKVSVTETDSTPLTPALSPVEAEREVARSGVLALPHD
jgi:type I restriction enzyme R subunit